MFVRHVQTNVQSTFIITYKNMGGPRPNYYKNKQFYYPACVDGRQGDDGIAKVFADNFRLLYNSVPYDTTAMIYPVLKR